MKVQGGQADSTYEGATVLEPKSGFYEKPVATLDFASLYPSIMMAHNLCYSTLGHQGRRTRLKLSPDDVCRSPCGTLCTIFFFFFCTLLSTVPWTLPLESSSSLLSSPVPAKLLSRQMKDAGRTKKEKEKHRILSGENWWRARCNRLLAQSL